MMEKEGNSRVSERVQEEFVEKCIKGNECGESKMNVLELKRNTHK
jgi:hypothetical protein